MVRTLRCGRSNPGSNPGHGMSSIIFSSFGIMQVFYVNLVFFFSIILSIVNIGFSTNGEGENKILAPRAIILDQAAKPRGQELSAQGARILF